MPFGMLLKTQNHMKKNQVLFAFLLLFGHISAQSLDSIAHHQCGYYGPNGGGQMDNVAQMSDGSVLFIHKVGINFGGNTSADVVGNVHYKVSRHGGVLLDTLFVPDSDPPFYLFDKSPNSDGNIRVGIVRDSTSGGSFLQIFPFDNDLNYDTLNEVMVPLSDTFAYNPSNGIFIDKQNDLIITYSTPSGSDDYTRHFACFGLDGTLKHENSTPSSSLPMNSYLGFGVFNESPQEYYWCGRNRVNNAPAHFVCYIFDSLFQYKDSFTIAENNPQYQCEYNFGWKECLLDDGDDFIFGSRFGQDGKNGVCLVRYDKQTLEEKDAVFFPSRPMIIDDIVVAGACPIGLLKDSEGNFCFSYNTQNHMFTDKGQIAVVKLDGDFNVLWQRFCLEPQGFFRHGRVMTVLDDGGIALGGGYSGLPEVFFLIINDDYDSIEEQGIAIRPYAFYPNPTQDQLRLQYSPDVQPKQIELYDLQGRLLRTQRKGLESLDMSQLPAGTYTMRVTLEDGKMFSDKVVKE